MSLPAILAAREDSETGFRADIPPAWLQGRTAYGGLTAALCYEAAKRAGEDLPPLRSAQISFVGPVSGRVTVTAKLERQGRNAAFVTARLDGEAGTGTLATFVFMRDLDSHVDFTGYPMPEVPEPRPIEQGTAPLGEAPQFISNFEMTSFETYPGQRPADMLRWFRPIEREGLDPVTEMVLIGDGLPPAAMAVMTERVNISSLTWLYNILHLPPPADDGWRLLQATSDHARHGASSQDMSVWDRNGKLLARGMQSIALFG